MIICDHWYQPSLHWQGSFLGLSWGCLSYGHSLIWRLIRAVRPRRCTDVVGGWCWLLAWNSGISWLRTHMWPLCVAWPSHSVVASFQKDSLESKCPKGRKWNLARYVLHSELARGHFLYILWVIGIPGPTLILEGGKIDTVSWWGVSGSPWRRTSKIEDTIAAFLGNYKLSKILKSKWDIKSL